MSETCGVKASGNGGEKPHLGLPLQRVQQQHQHGGEESESESESGSGNREIVSVSGTSCKARRGQRQVISGETKGREDDALGMRA